MPKENRKRGKKRRREDEKTATGGDAQESAPELDNPKPSWIVSASKEVPESNTDAPFGYVDADVKAYFRTVDIQLRQWQDNEVEDDHETANSSEG
jgi:nucleolar protein 9